jgi:glycerophosphoryl diester phosphodiesterase
MMNFFLQPRSQPLVIAHRGSSAHAPENTLAAFELAAAQGADAVELDVTLTHDRQMVVIHDDTLERTTDGRGRVTDLSYAEIRRVDAGAQFGDRYAGQRVPLLSEVFETVGHRVLINVEIKGSSLRSAGVEGLVLNLIRQHDLCERVLISSFNPLILMKVKRLEPDAACGLIYSPAAAIYLRRAWLAPFISDLNARHPRSDLVTPERVKQTHARGQRINVWTVNDAATVRRLAAAGVDGLIGNDPIIIRTALDGT